ncbi:MAG: MMPL family transporter, partial [Bacteroidota bacterium]
MALQIPHLQFDYDIEKFFPIENKETRYYDQYKKVFGTDNDFILVVVKADAGIFNSNFLLKLEELTDSLTSLPLVNRVFSLSNAYEYKFISGFRKPRKIPFVHPENFQKMIQDSLKVMSSPLLRGYLIAPDASSALIYIANKAKADSDECQQLNLQIRNLCANYELGQFYFSGKCIGQSTFSDTIQKEIGIFIIASVLVIILVLFFMFRSLPALILPLLVVGLAVLWTMGIMVLMDRDLSLVSNIIPSILLVIGVSDVIHLLSHFIQLRKEGRESYPALKEAIRKVGIATILTSITTILGFLSLLSTRFFLLHELGLFASLGVFLALVMTYALIPPFIQYFPYIKLSNTSPKQKLRKFLLKLFDFTQKHKKLIVILSLALLLVSGLIASYIQVNIYLLTDLRKDHPLVQDFTYISDNYGGSRPQEFKISLRDSSKILFSTEVLAELAKVETYLREEYTL